MSGDLIERSDGVNRLSSSNVEAIASLAAREGTAPSWILESLACEVLESRAEIVRLRALIEKGEGDPHMNDAGAALVEELRAAFCRDGADAAAVADGLVAMVAGSGDARLVAHVRARVGRLRRVLEASCSPPARSDEVGQVLDRVELALHRALTLSRLEAPHERLLADRLGEHVEALSSQKGSNFDLLDGAGSGGC